MKKLSRKIYIKVKINFLTFSCPETNFRLKKWKGLKKM